MSNRVGGLSKVQMDPAVASMLKEAAVNKASLTKKQKADRKRVRVKYDLDLKLKTAIEREAKRQGTSASQLAALLLAYSVKEAKAGNVEIREALMTGKTPSNNMRFEWNLDAPEKWTSSNDGDD